MVETAGPGGGGTAAASPAGPNALITTDGPPQYLRQWGLTVGNPGGAALNLSLSEQGFDLQFQFRISHKDVQTPSAARIRVLNLSDTTAQRIQNEFSTVVLQAGYPGTMGLIFTGTIKQVRRGRINAVDTYCDILAADGDVPYNFGVANQSLAAGYTDTDLRSAILTAFNDNPLGLTISPGYLGDITADNPAPRGRVLYGMARDYARDFALSRDFTWSIINGQFQLVPLKGYIPGDAIVLTSNTGMIGLPEQTENGISVKCLLNPNIRHGRRVQINNKSVQRALQPIAYPQQNFFFPSIANDGFYRVLAVDHYGDTRGNDWYSELICIALDGTAPITQAAVWTSNDPNSMGRNFCGPPARVDRDSDVRIARRHRRKNDLPGM